MAEERELSLRIVHEIIKTHEAGKLSVSDLVFISRRLLETAEAGIQPDMSRDLPESLEVGGFILEPYEGRLFVPKINSWVKPAPKQSLILGDLMINSPKGRSHEQLANAADISEEGDYRPLVQTHIYNTRKLIHEVIPPKNLVTIRGVYGTRFAFLP